MGEHGWEGDRGTCLLSHAQLLRACCVLAGYRIALSQSFFFFHPNFFTKFLFFLPKFPESFEKFTKYLRIISTRDYCETRTFDQIRTRNYWETRTFHQIRTKKFRKHNVTQNFLEKIHSI